MTLGMFGCAWMVGGADRSGVITGWLDVAGLRPSKDANPPSKERSSDGLSFFRPLSSSFSSAVRLDEANMAFCNAATVFLCSRRRRLASSESLERPSEPPLVRVLSELESEGRGLV